MNNKEKQVLLKGLSKFVDEKNIKKLRIIVDEFHSSEIYNVIKDWPMNKVILLIRFVEEEQAADIFGEFDPEDQAVLIDRFTDEEIGEIFDEMFTDEAVDVLEELPPEITTRVLMASDHSTREKINKILRYEKSDAGYHMLVDFVIAHSKDTVKQTQVKVKKQITKEDLEIVDNIWVIDENNKFAGYIKPDALISEEDSEKIEDILEYTDAIKTTSNIKDAQDIMTKFDMSSAPVINNKNELIGVIEADDIIEIFKEFDDAIFDQAAIVQKARKPYLETSSWEIFKARSFWIIMLLIIGSITQLIIMGFQTLWSSELGASGETNWTIPAIAASTALATAATISGTAGNTGNQSTSNLIRALALNEINEDNYGIALKKETYAGLMMGAAAAFVSFFRMYAVWLIMELFTYNSPGGGIAPFADGKVLGYFIIAIIASLAFFIAIIIGNLLGTVLPIIADKWNWDGAIVSGPVQTTLVDIFTFTIYLSMTTPMVLCWG